MPLSNPTVNEVDLSASLASLLIDALEILNDIGSTFNPYWAAASAIFEIAQLAGMPNPLDVMIQAFTGRPKQVATIQIAIRLLNTRNPVSRLWGIEIAQYLKQDDAVLSDSHPAVQKIFGGFRKQFIDGLEKQGVTKIRALEIAHTAYTEAAQAGLKAEPELLRAQPDWLRPYGDPAINQIYDRAVTRLDQKHLTEAQINHRASVDTMRYATLKELASIRWVHWLDCPLPQTFDPQTEACRSPLPQCPPGSTWDPQLEKCVPLLTPPPCPPGTTWNPQTETCEPNTIPPLDLEGDEFTDCCSQTQAALVQVNTNLQTIINQGSGSGGSSDAQCCAEITAQLADIVSTLAAIANKSALVEVDFSQLIPPLAEAAVELACICTALEAWAGGAPLNLESIVASLDRVAAGLEVPATIVLMAQQTRAWIISQDGFPPTLASILSSQ